MIKIPPAWQVDKKMHNATGIILDDIISGFYASIVLYGLFYYSVI
jgi:phosphatidylglycerophosphatase A